MKITVVFFSNRQGCIDLMVMSLLPQVFDSQKVSYDLVVIDGYPGRVERGEVEVFLTSASMSHDGPTLPLRAYSAPKAKTFPWSRTGFANAMNSGIMLSDGDYVVFLHDYTHINPDAIALWAEAFSKYSPKTLISGIMQWCKSPKPDNLSDVTTYKDYPLQIINEDLWVPETFEIAYWGAPTSFFDECNGIDERADFCSQFSLYAVMAHAKALGYNLVVDSSLNCMMVRHHYWDKGIWEGPINSEWRMKGAFCDVPTEPIWTGWAANPYNMAEERRKNDEILSRPLRLHPRFYLSLTRDTPKVAEMRSNRIEVLDR